MISFNFNDNAYFQSSGASVWKDILLPIGCVFLGYIISELANFRKTSKEIRESGENFIIEINLIYTAITEQITELETYNNNLKSTIPTATPLRMVALLDFKRIESINKSLLYRFFIKKIKDKRKVILVVDKMYSHIRGIETTMNRIDMDFEKMVTKQIELTMQLNVEGKKILEQSGDWVRKNIIINKFSQEQIKSDVFYSFLREDTIPKIQDSNSQNIFELNKKVFHPLAEKCIDFTAHPLAELILDTCRRSIRLVDELHFSKNRFSSRFTSYTETMKNEKQKLESTLKEYKLLSL